jgi:drug/metabolite transporter (DMT)-like permease
MKNIDSSSDFMVLADDEYHSQNLNASPAKPKENARSDMWILYALLAGCSFAVSNVLLGGYSQQSERARVLFGMGALVCGAAWWGFRLYHEKKQKGIWYSW